MHQEPIETPFGLFRAEFSSQGLARLHFPSGSDRVESGGRGAPARAEASRWGDQTKAAVLAVLAGRKPGALPPLDLGGATVFQRKVWEVLRSLGPGQVLTYGAVAKRLGRPRAFRAVGGACGSNPIPLLIPCHRVLAANGKIGGFSGGLEWKRRLLAIEGVTVES